MTFAHNAVGCYIFAGGFTLGVSKHMNVLAHFEDGSYGVETFKANFPDVPVWKSPHTWPADKFKGVDLLYGNPPCAAWSVAGASLRRGSNNWFKDERVNCTRRLFALLDTMRPKVWVWESVTQAFTRGRPFVMELTRRAVELGYAVTFLFTSGHYHGIPQPRQRFMMFCHNIELDLHLHDDWYPITVGMSLGLKPDGTQECPVWGVPPCDKRLEKLFAATGADQSMRKMHDDIDPESEWRPAFMMHRLRADGYGTTFTSMVMHIHPTQDRWLADSEVGRLSGYPDDYIWKGPPRPQMAQAVLPAVGDFVGKRVTAALHQNKPISPGIHKVDHREEAMCGS